MGTTHSSGKVQLLFPAQSLDKGILNNLRGGGLSLSAAALSPVAEGAASSPALAAPASLESITADQSVFDEMSKLSDNILGIDFEKLLKVFKGLKIEQVELWINGAAETEGLLKLALSAKGEGGIKIVLKPE